VTPQFIDTFPDKIEVPSQDSQGKPLRVTPDETTVQEEYGWNAIEGSAGEESPYGVAGFNTLDDVI